MLQIFIKSTNILPLKEIVCQVLKSQPKCSSYNNAININSKQNINRR
jgi:hypothetical protein